MSDLLYNLTPDQIVPLLGHYTTITLNTNKTVHGYIYTIDPESGNVVLFDQKQKSVLVVMSHFIKEVKIDNENQIDLQTIDTILKYQKENKFIQEWIDQRREKLIQLFKRNRIPVDENSKNEPVIHVLGSARVESPYVATSVVCENALIRKRVRDLILQLEI